LLVPAARVALVAIIGLTAALFFGPLWKIHRRMAAVRQEYENQYARRLDQLMRTSSATVLNASDSDVTQAAERLTYLQNLSPESVRLSDWPIDGRMVVKYVVTPIGTLLSLFVNKIIVDLLK
jgi:Flp pilus assembly protein CpaB